MSISPQILTQILQSFHLTENDCLKYVANDITWDDKSLQNLSENFALEKAQKLGANAVYFRRFDNRPSIAQIYIYTTVTIQEIPTIHKNIWSSNEVSLSLFIMPENVIIRNTGTNSTDKNAELDQFSVKDILSKSAEIVEKINQKYSAELFEQGLFWEKKENAATFSFAKSSYNKLLEKLKFTRKKIKEKYSSLSNTYINRLLIQCVLMKYLEERNVFPLDYFQQYGGSSFREVLEGKNTLQLFDDLNRLKNGQIFLWEEKEKIHIAKSENIFGELAQLFYKDKEISGQLLFWDAYSFQHLPVELISSVYEELCGDNKAGSVYTPPYLAAFLIDECMPLEKPKKACKLIDPACGSGIFLVLAFKRLVQWHQILTGEQPARANLPQLKKLLEKNIFGVDKDEDAGLLTMFSLCLALCDMLSPTEIWHHLKFPDLKEKNIFTQDKDFFKWKKNAPNDFDLVIGNPPFIKNKPLTPAAEEIETERVANNLPALPQKEIAMLFIEQSLQLLKSNKSLCCLLVPSETLIYQEGEANTTLFFRQYLFGQNNVHQILDFTPLRRILFGGATVATSAIFLSSGQPTNETILHLILRRTKTSRERKYFEVDSYDFNWVPYNAALSDSMVWKSNLMGGGRLYNCIKFLNKQLKLSDFLTKVNVSNHKKNNHNYKLIIKQNIGKSHISSLILPINDEPNEEWFKKEEMKLYAENRDILAEIQHKLNATDLFKFYIMCTSERAGLGRSMSSILVKDILNIPYSADTPIKLISYEEKVLIPDTLNYMEDFIRLGENSKILLPIPSEKLNNRIHSFGNYFCESLNRLYAKDGKQFRQGKVGKTRSYICTSFVYGTAEQAQSVDFSKAGISLTEEDIKTLVHEIKGNIKYNRIIIIYKPDMVYFIKPNQYRYWLDSIALRDADRVFGDMVANGH